MEKQSKSFNTEFPSYSSKRSYYAQAINENKRNPRQLWKSLHELTNKPTRSTSFSIHDANGKPILDPEQTADTFNKFFVSIHESYNTNNILSSYENNKLATFVQSKLPSDFNFEIPSISETFVKNQLASLDPKKATGIDGISANFLKLSSHVLARPLTKNTKSKHYYRNFS